MQMNINDMVDLMTPLYAKTSPKKVPSLMIWGPPGIGKSQSFREIAIKLENLARKNVVITDVRLLLFNPVDLRGIPVADAKKELAIWLKPQIFQMNSSEDVINILILDEISAAPLSVQAAAYQITLDRIIGEHKLPDNCIVVAAGNRVTDKSVSYKMPKALANRMTHIEMVCDVDDWKKWAIPHGIDSTIIGYVNFKNSSLFQFDPSNDDVAYPTPRSWEMVDTYIKQIGSIEKAFPLIAGSIGLGAATEFRAYTKVYDKLPSIKDIMDGKKVEMPSEPSILYALSSTLSANVQKAKETELKNIINFILEMPAEFATLTIRDIAVIESLRKKIQVMPEWIQGIKKYRGFIM